MGSGTSDDRRSYEALERRVRELEAEVERLSHYRKIFDSSDTMVAIVDFEGRFVEVNGAWTRHLGYAREALVGRPFLDFVYPPDREVTIAEAERLIREGAHNRLQRNRYLDSDGNPVWLCWRSFTDLAAGLHYCVIDEVTDDVEDHDLFRRAAELSGVGVWEHDLRTDALRGSEEVYRIYGVPADTPITVPQAIDAFAPEARQRVADAVEEAAREGVPWDLEVPLINAQGQHLWVRSQGAVAREGGEPSRIYGVIQDITARHLAEEARRLSDERFRGVFDALPLPALVFGDGHGARGNRRFDELIGWPADAFLEGWWIERAIVDPARRPDAADTWESALSAQPADDPHELTLSCRDGVERVFALQVAFAPDSQVVLFEEVGERRALVAALERRRLVLSELHSLSADPAADLDAKIDGLLDLGCDYFGLDVAFLLVAEGEWLVIDHLAAPADLPIRRGDRRPREGTISEELLQRGQAAVVHTSDPARLETISQIAGFPVSELLTTAIHVDGDGVAVLAFLGRAESRYHFIDDRDGEMMKIFAQWLGHHMHARRVLSDLASAKESAEATSRAKSSFLATMSHELRTPMNGIIGMSEVILGEGIDGRLAEQIETIRASGIALRTVLNQVLDLSKIEAGKLEIEVTPFSPEQVIGGVIDLMRARIVNKGLALRTSIAWPRGYRALGDGLRLRQIAVNLIDNAIKFTDRGEICVTLGHQWLGPRMLVRLEVKDSGPGIEPGDLDRLFTPFERATHSRAASGTGLGLAICRELADRMGGTTGCASRPGEGSRFWVEIPFGVERVAEPEPPPRPRAPRPSWEGRRVLLAEDEPVNQVVAESFLELLGCVVDVAGDGEVAVERFREESYDAIIMDCRMPRLDGLSATATIRELERPRGCRTPIVALTANAMPGDRERCIAAGMDDFVAKPMTLDDLADVLARIWSADVPAGLVGSA
ncbi:MAG: PAS domain S-box protein [Myxococcales bacterium]|nr:PAS domain S-box protein [Myxococcales bacterium]